jgi:hypothetical protein
MLGLVAIMVAAIVGGTWGRMIFRGEPWLYGARRCLREREKPGERRFLTRLLFKPALVFQTTGSDGRVSRVVVLIPGFGKGTLVQTLLPIAKDSNAWPDKDGRYEIDCSSSHRHYPGLEKVRTWAEYHPEWGVQFVAERMNGLVSIPGERRLG